MDTLLRLDYCSHESALYACKTWHYSRCMPVGKTVKIGVWENNQFIGAVIFARGANRNIGSPYGLNQTECVELARVALNRHKSPVTQIVSIAVKILKRLSPSLKLIVSYADLDQGHEGTIYQAGNWIYTGLTNTTGKQGYLIHGSVMHGKSVYSKYGAGRDNVKWLRENIDPNAKEIPTKGKHRYLMPLTMQMRNDMLKLSKPYPRQMRD